MARSSSSTWVHCTAVAFLTPPSSQSETDPETANAEIEHLTQSESRWKEKSNKWKVKVIDWLIRSNCDTLKCFILITDYEFNSKLWNMPTQNFWWNLKIWPCQDVPFWYAKVFCSNASYYLQGSIAHISHNHTAGGGVLFSSWCTFSHNFGLFWQIYALFGVFSYKP